ILAKGGERWRAAEKHSPRGSKTRSHTARARINERASPPLSLSHCGVPPSEQEEQVRRDVHAANDICSLIVAVELCLT
ncbi:hypothetical protein CSPX01_11660, partial [Colletotrichum filicis]